MVRRLLRVQEFPGSSPGATLLINNVVKISSIKIIFCDIYFKMKIFLRKNNHLTMNVKQDLTDGI